MIKLINLFVFLFGVFLAQAQYTSPFNQRTIQSDSTGNYSFIVSGHFYGDGTNLSHFPANTLLANLDWINSTKSEILVCLGDLFKDISNEIPNYKASFFDQLEMPLVNTVGNHDLTGSVYQENFGETGFYFEVNQDIHLIIDTELDNGDIEGEQLERLKAISKQVKSGDIHNVFIYTHRTVWVDAYPQMEGLFLDNTQSISATNYKDEVLPILKEITAHSKVFWFSGSLGAAPASFFHFEDAQNGVTIIGTAIRALTRDAMLIVNVNNGAVTFELHSLTGQELLPLESYNIDFWQTEVGAEPYNWKLSVYYVQLIVTHRYFWYGILFSIASFFVLRFIWNRFLKKRIKPSRNKV